MSNRLEDMQRQIQAEIHRQVEERVHSFFSASREDLHVALAAIFRLYQDERKRANNALRRAEEAEAIANLAMAEGLRLWTELSVERTKVAKVKEIVTPPSCMSAGELLARLRGLPSHMPLFVGGTPGTHKHIEIRDRVPDLTPCLYLQDGETVASLADRLDRAIRDVREGVCGDRYTIRDDAPVWVTVDGDSKPVTRVRKGNWWATLMPPPKYSAQFKIDMVLDLLTETASENTDGCRRCGREEATFVGDECIHCIVLERDHLRHKLSAESERPRAALAETEGSDG